MRSSRLFLLLLGIMLSFSVTQADARSSGGGRSSFGSRSSSRPAARPSPAPSYRSPATPARPAAPAVRPQVAPKAAPSTGTAAAPKATPRDPATVAATRFQSGAALRASTAPRPSLTTASGRSVRVGGTPAASSVRTSMNPTTFSTRSQRQSTYYSSVPAAQRPVIINQYGGSAFGDPFNGLFMYMLLSQSLSNQASFHHNHWDEYSAERQQKLVAENAALKVELEKMKGQPRDPNYAPKDVDKDLIYSDEFVEAAYNPVEEDEGVGFGTVLLVALGLGTIGLGTWFLFFRRSEY